MKVITVLVLQLYQDRNRHQKQFGNLQFVWKRQSNNDLMIPLDGTVDGKTTTRTINSEMEVSDTFIYFFITPPT